MEPIVSKSLPVSLNQHRSHRPIFQNCNVICDFLEPFVMVKPTHDHVVVLWPVHIGNFSEASDFIGSEVIYLGN